MVAPVTMEGVSARSQVGMQTALNARFVDGLETAS